MTQIHQVVEDQNGWNGGENANAGARVSGKWAYCGHVNWLLTGKKHDTSRYHSCRNEIQHEKQYQKKHNVNHSFCEYTWIWRPKTLEHVAFHVLIRWLPKWLEALSYKARIEGAGVKNGVKEWVSECHDQFVLQWNCVTKCTSIEDGLNKLIDLKTAGHKLILIGDMVLRHETHT